MTDCRGLTILACTLSLLSGCSGAGNGESTGQPLPRPITAVKLKKSNPSRSARVSGSVASWKTDELGMEVTGRVLSIVEPETNFQGPLLDAEGNVSRPGTELARIDPTRYELSVEIAKAAVDVAQKDYLAAEIELNDVIPAKLEEAQAKLELARAELDRSRRLRTDNAASAREAEAAEARFKQSDATIKELSASRESQRAQLASIGARIRDQQAAQKQAEQDLEDCILHAPFAGQVAEVFGVPGTFVNRGDPVLTIQMMDPIAIEFEVSGESARRFKYRDQIPIFLAREDGSELRLESTFYQIDPVADSQTRTFTVTLLAFNNRVGPSVPEGIDSAVVARAKDITRILPSVLQSDGYLLLESAVYQDSEGSFGWRILNRDFDSLSLETDPVLKVEKTRLQLGQKRIRLGQWSFAELLPETTNVVDPNHALFVDELTVPGGKAELWRGDTVFFDRKRWLLRPGDLVEVSLDGRSARTGFYVPSDVILESADRTYVFVVESEDGTSSVRQLEVNPLDIVGTLRRIESVGDEPLTEGMRLAAQGALFLVDGEKVRVTREQEAGE